jgi:transcriptional regulator with XRE-family HTH domain
MDAITILHRLGQQLRAARTARGLTQAQVAERTGMPRLKVVQVEAGKETVAIGYYARVAGGLGMQVNLEPARTPTLDELRAMDF